MTIYTFPPSLWRVSKISLTLEAFSASTPTGALNPLSYQNGPTTELARASVEIAPQDEDQWRDVAALLRKLRGKMNKVRLYDPSRPLRGAGAAGPTINVATAAAAGATSLEVYGLTASQSEALAADDVFGIGENIHFMSDAAPSNGSGEATLSFLAPLRRGVAEGDPITLPSSDPYSITGPTGLFTLMSGAAQSIVPGRTSMPLTLEFSESPDFE